MIGRSDVQSEEGVTAGDDSGVRVDIDFPFWTRVIVEVACRASTRTRGEHVFMLSCFQRLHVSDSIYETQKAGSMLYY